MREGTEKLLKNMRHASFVPPHLNSPISPRQGLDFMRAAGVGISEGNLKDYLEEVLLQYACHMGGVITETSVVQKISGHSSNYVVVVSQRL